MATMLDCKKVQPRISEYIDGAVDGDEAWSMRLHIDSCAVCSRIADELRGAASLLRDLPALAPSANFEAMLASRLADQALRPKRSGFSMFWSRFAEWWAMPRVSPAMATGAVALAVLAPVAVLTVHHSASPVADAAVTAHTAPVQNASMTPVAGDPTLDEMWREHSSYAASEPLADPAGMLQARSGTPAPNSAVNAGAMDLSL